MWLFIFKLYLLLPSIGMMSGLWAHLQHDTHVEIRGQFGEVGSPFEGPGGQTQILRFVKQVLYKKSHLLSHLAGPPLYFLIHGL